MTDRGSFRIARIAGVELYLHYSWLVIAALITISLGEHFQSLHQGWSPATIWACAVITGALFFASLIGHELSHAMVARARGLPVRRITLFLLGGVAQIEREARRASTEFLMAVAGPAMSVAIGLVSLALSLLLGWNWGQPPVAPATAVLVWLGFINLMLAAFNLIPGFPMDGGRVLRAIIWWISGDEQKSTRVAAYVGQVIGWLFIAFGLWQFFTGRGFGSLWLALIGWFLLQASGSTLVNATTRSALQGISAAQVMSRDCATIGSNLDLETFVHSYLLGTSHRCFLVTDGTVPRGLITGNEVRAIDRGQWASKTVAEAMVPLGKVKVIRPETPAIDALNEMASENVNQLPVIDQGQVVGVLSRSNILQILQNRADLRAA